MAGVGFDHQPDVASRVQLERVTSGQDYLQSADQLVTTALYLASPASSYTTGSLVRVDGGLY